MDQSRHLDESGSTSEHDETQYQHGEAQWVMLSLAFNTNFAYMFLLKLMTLLGTRVLLVLGFLWGRQRKAVNNPFFPSSKPLFTGPFCKACYSSFSYRLQIYKFMIITNVSHFLLIKTKLMLPC